MKKLFFIALFAGLLMGAISCNNNSNSTDTTIESIADMNKKDGEKYIASQMKKDPAFVQTKSGLCYKILNEGEGENF